MVIREVTESDAQELLEIYTPYVKETAISFEYEVPTLEEFKERIRGISRKYPYLKAEEDGRIVGYAYANTFKGRKAYDWSVETTIYVQNDRRRQGLGRLLYGELERALADRGILNMYACIASPTGEDVHLTDASLRFHEKMGFTLVGEFHQCGYKFETWYDMVWMEKIIGEHVKYPKEIQARGETL